MKIEKNLKIFFIKLVSIFLFAVLLTSFIFNTFIGNKLDKITTILELSEKNNRDQLKEKIRKEISNSLEKDRILSIEDSELIKKFIKKIIKEIDIN